MPTSTVWSELYELSALQCITYASFELSVKIVPFPPGHSGAGNVIAALAVGLACGLWNGFLVAVLDIQPIIATLVLMVAGRGIAQLITEGYIVTFNDPALIFIGTGSVLGFPMAAVIAVVLMILVTLIVKRTAIGLFIQAIGVRDARHGRGRLRGRRFALGDGNAHGELPSSSGPPLSIAVRRSWGIVPP